MPAEGPARALPPPSPTPLAGPPSTPHSLYQHRPINPPHSAGPVSAPWIRSQKLADQRLPRRELSSVARNHKRVPTIPGGKGSRTWTCIGSSISQIAPFEIVSRSWR